MIYFTADTHFGHANVLNFTERPYRSIEQMNRALVNNINSRVGLRDELYILGDFGYKLGIQEQAAIREAIFCRNVHLVLGNHDHKWDTPGWDKVFILERDICQVKLSGGRRFICCHYPMVDWPGLSRGSIHLHGHIHSRPSYNEWNREMRLLRYDVGVDANDMAPVSEEEILAFFAGVEHRHRATRDTWEAVAYADLPEPTDEGWE